MSWLVILALIFGFYNAVLTANGLPMELREYSYHNDLKLKKTIEDVLSEIEEDDIHARILAVNEAHKKHQDQSKQNSKPEIDVDENIIETNLEQGVHLFEGDIDLGLEQIVMIKETGTLQKRTAGQQSRYNLWHDRLVPYLIAPSLKSKRHLIRQAVAIFQRDTCLKFYEMSGHSSNANYLYIDSRNGCHSKIGKSSFKSQQLLSLGHGCHDIGTILHEMTHAIGFWHEQARPDRNKYVKVIWENILPGQEHNFERHDISSVDTMNIPYDYLSIMHYGKTSFTKNGGNTLESINDPKAKLGRAARESNGFSAYDKTAINALYECTKFPGNYRGFSSWSEWMPCNWDCKRYRQRFCMNVGNPYWREKLCPGAESNGVQIEYKKCTSSECGPIDGGWSMWSLWSSCNAKCGSGTRTRKRKCDNPYPMRKGKKCPGSENGTGKCTAGKCKLGYYETQFDHYKTGTWKVEGKSYKTWKVENLWRNPGPKGDHTTGKGTWLYYPTARMDFQSNPNHKARLFNTFGWGNPFCLTFWYVMDGPSVGTLTVNIKIQMANDKRRWTVFTARGSKGRDWRFAEVFINVKDKNFEVSIDAVGSGSKEEGTIALDDLYQINGRCPSIPTVKPTTPPCVDINLKCKTWAYEGECAKRPKYMDKFCRKSCVCQPVKCKDTHKKCAFWADKDECDKNPGWMKKSCCVSCRLEKACSDSSKYKKKCPVWAKDGECSKNSGWMKKNCCKSCRKASYERPCNDKNDNCAKWAKKGECKKNRVWMVNNCCKACRSQG